MRGFSHLPPTLLSLVLILNNIPQTVQYLAPSPRWGHAATLINNMVYFYGGKTGAPGVTRNGSENTNDLLVIDLSTPFSLSSIPWTDIILPVSGPKAAYHAVTYGGSGYNTLFLFGGLPDPSLLNYTAPTNPTPTDFLVAETLNVNNTTATDPLINQTLYTYDSVHILWDHQPPPASTATPEPSRRIEHTLVTRPDTGITYLFGGLPLTNDLYTLDTNALTWTLVAQSTAPTPRYHHTSSLLPDGRMIVLGGFDGSNMISMLQVWSFDTNVGKWSVSNATGNAPANRRDHVAVATNDGKVIIHGGTDQGFVTFYSDIAVLDCSADAYTWSVPQVSGKIPAGRYTHTATLAGTNMIIAFGFLADQTGDYNIYVLDTTNFTWVNTYNPANLQFTSYSSPSNSGSSSNMPSSSSTSAGLVAGATLASLAVVALLAAALFFFICRHRNKEDRLFTRRYEDTPTISYTQWGATPGRTPAPPPRKQPNKVNISPRPSNDAGLVAAALFGKDAVWRRIGAGRRGSQSSESSADGDIHSNIEGTTGFKVVRRPEELLRPPPMEVAGRNSVPSSANPEPGAFLLPPPRKAVGGLQLSGEPSPADDLDLDGRAVPLDVGVRSYFVPRQKLFVVNPDNDGRSTSIGSLKSLKSEDGER